ncbi:hypothetical protein SISNIDRAFT_432302 [Sistotremastrum niveocremeum HHB9708]|uniref:Glycoside hydrolase family 71 protein n=1 Tax=Sistotremastrum niveocremeum HHB9708 TaxID=1314777 RepID=A0A164PML0_9AGAM|nr:hypothetical protein SISNIDRAFT_432302 [Sistotremastrum niveocremeum HHB9708]
MLSITAFLFFTIVTVLVRAAPVPNPALITVTDTVTLYSTVYKPNLIVQPSTSTTPTTSTTSTSKVTTTTPTTTSTTKTTSTTSSVSSSSSSPVPTASSARYVFAHHMVGNTYPYKVADWLADIQKAYAAGIDGFALNMGIDSWQSARVADAYTAAAQSGTPFKLFISFDMTSLGCSSPADAANLRSYITTYANHPNQFRYSSSGTPKPFASTFSGENCNFGQGSYTAGWQTQFYQPLTNGGPGVSFWPSFFVDPATLGSQQFTDGAFAWNSGWPTQLTTGSLSTNSESGRTSLASQVGDGSMDSQYLNALKGSGKGYLAAISPWFFTHYSPQTYNKNWIYLADDHLYAKRWETVIANRNQIPIAEIITWNDYGESHYIGPIEGAQPNSQAWVDGFDHTGWLAITSYYAKAFKTGVYPTISKDQVVLYARPHPRDANSPDPVARPTNYQLVSDTLWAVVLASAPSTVTITTSPTTSQSFSVPAGVSKLSVPLVGGNTMRATVTRGSHTFADTGANSFVFNANPPSYNFNAYVVASP